MPRPGLTEEQLLEAVEVLLSSGRNVTVSAIRDVLGTGSFSTISAFLAKWKDSRSKAADLQLPEMPESVDRAAKTFWSIAVRDAQASVKLDREALEAARKEMETEKQEMEVELARLEAENSGLSEHLEQLQAQLTHSQTERKQLEDTVNALQIDQVRLVERLQSSETLTKALQDQLDTLNETFKAMLAQQPKPGKPASSSSKAGKKSSPRVQSAQFEEQSPESSP